MIVPFFRTEKAGTHIVSNKSISSAKINAIVLLTISKTILSPSFPYKKTN
jgi:hypothetical protein